MKKILFSFFLVGSLLLAGNASAHNFWISLTESLNHPPGHVISQLGFGHSLPIDDFLVGDFGKIEIAKYQLVGPKGEIADLGALDLTPSPTLKTPTELIVQQGDLGLRKISITKKSEHGTYQVVAESEPTFFTSYVNTKGKMRIAPLPIDAISDVKEVKSSFYYGSVAKAFFAVGEWSEPKPMGHSLEVLPLDNMADLHEGDLVHFSITFNGRPVNANAEFIATMDCYSNAFGGPDKFHLSSTIIDGKAQFRMPAAGQWAGVVLYQQKVTGNASMKKFAGKCTQVFTAASIGFTVKP